MKQLRCTLLADGTTDDALVFILNWLLRIHLRGCDPRVELVPPYLLPPRREGLKPRINRALKIFPCDLLFVHRDTEKQSIESRISEIRKGLENVDHTPAVCVVPMRMTEAWLLIDEPALRMAAGNPNGTIPLNFPNLRRLEALPDPKQTLDDLLRMATQFGRRRRDKFCPNQARRRLAELIQDYSALRNLSAFRALEQELTEILSELR